MFNHLKTNYETRQELNHNEAPLFRRFEFFLSQPHWWMEGELSPSSSCELYPVWLGFLSSFTASVPISLTTFSVPFPSFSPFNLSIPHLPLHTSFILIISFKSFAEMTLTFSHICPFPVKCYHVFVLLPAVQGCALSGLCALLVPLHSSLLYYLM